MADQIRIVHYLNQFFGGVGRDLLRGFPGRLHDAFSLP